jgi:hypothetical protein
VGEEAEAMIYILTGVPSYHLKVGYTKSYKALQERVRQVQTGHPFKVHVLATFEGDQSLESQIHSRLSAYRENGEWYVNTKEARVLLAQYAVAVLADCSLVYAKRKVKTEDVELIEELREVTARAGEMWKRALEARKENT